MARFRRARAAYNRAYFSRYSPIRTRRFTKGRFGASFNPMYLAGAAVGLGLGDNYIPRIGKTAISLYGALPVSIRGLGMVKHFARGYILGQIIRGATGINLSGVTGGSSATGSTTWY